MDPNSLHQKAIASQGRKDQVIFEKAMTFKETTLLNQCVDQQQAQFVYPKCWKVRPIELAIKKGWKYRQNWNDQVNLSNIKSIFPNILMIFWLATRLVPFLIS